MPKGRRRLPSGTSGFFRNGRNQAVRIPREFELPGEKATMRKCDPDYPAQLASDCVVYEARW